MMNARYMAIVACIIFLEALVSNDRKNNDHVRPKDKQGDCLYCCANLKFETWIWNVAAVVMCKDVTAKRTMRALELKATVFLGLRFGGK